MKSSAASCIPLFLAAAIALWPSELWSAASEDFERGIVPSGWTSNQKDSLSVIDKMPRSGKKSLLWKLNYSSDIPDQRKDIQAYLRDHPTHTGLRASFFHENILTVRFDAPVEINDPGKGLSLWFYCRRMECAPMLRLEILSGDEVVGRGWYSVRMGWRHLGFPYERASKGPVTGFRLLAPTNYPPQWPYGAPDYLCLDDVECNANKTSYDGEEIEPLDGPTVPKSLTPDSSGRLTMSAERYKSGNASLLWTWDHASASLLYSNPIGFGRINKRQCFAFWVHNETPSPKKLRLELLGKGRVLGHCWYTLDFQGWHVLAAPYVQIGWNGVDRVDSVRLIAPNDATRGRFHLDFVNLTCIGEGAGGYRAATPCADFVQPWMGSPEFLKNPTKCLFSNRDLSINRPWLPRLVSADAITPRQMADMEKLGGSPPPFPKKQTGSIPSKRLKEIEDLLRHWEIKESDGVVTGRPITSRLNSPPEAFHTYKDFNELLNRSINAHWDARRIGDEKSASRLKKISCLLLDFAADQGMFSCSDNFNLLSLELGRCECVATKETFQKLLYCTFFGIGGGIDICKEEPMGDTDVILGSYSRLPRIISMFPNPAERLQKYQAFVRGINRICERVDLQPFGPDGTAFHHGMHHWSYASYEIPVLLHFVETLNKTSFQLSPAVNEIIKKWIFTMAWSACKYTMPSSLQSRPGDICTLNMAELARRLAECGSADGREPLDRELASLHLALTDKPDAEPAKKYRALGIPPYEFTGHRVLNGAATSIHRRDDWMVAVIGMNRNVVRGLEIYGGEHNSSSRFAHNGALSVVSSGNPVSCQASGWSFDGWNSFHYPGATNPLSADQQSIQSNYYLLANNSAFAGGTDLDGDGIWGYEHRCQGFRFNKSVFFFGRRATAITSDIQHTDKSREPFVTTLYQNAFAGKPENEPSYIDGKEDKLFPSETTLPPGPSHWLLDNKATGYYVHPCGGPLKISRHPQTWSYFGRATSNNFALAYFAGEPGPRAPDCAYTIVVRSNPKEMAEFSKAMESIKTASYRIVQTDPSAHVLWDRETKTTGYVLFAGSTWTPPSVKSDPRTARLLSVSRPCTVMVREGGDKLKISVASPDWKDPTPLALTIQGEWKIERTDTAQPCKVEVKGGATRMEISYEFNKPTMGYMPIHATLEKDRGE